MAKPVKSTGELIDEIVRESLCSDEGARWRPVGQQKRPSSKNPYEWSWQELDAVREESRHIYRFNEFALGGTECRTGYVTGDGFQYEFVARKGQSPPSAALADLNAWLADFLALNAMDEIEDESVLRLDRDGEAFHRLFPGDDPELPEVRVVEPERVRAPLDEEGQIDSDSLMGVKTAPKDAQRVLGYWIEPGPGEEPEEVPVSEVVHLRANTDSSCRRGCPVYFPVFDNLYRCEDLLTSMSAVAKARAKIAVLIKSAHLAPERAEDIERRLTSSVQTMPDGTRKRVTIEDLPFGAMVRTNTGEEWEMPSASMGAAELVDVLQADLRAVGVRMVMPEWMFTGLADAKYSNAFVVESPTLRKFRKIQKFLAQRFGEWNRGHRSSLVWKAAVMSGRFDAALLRQVGVKVTVPSLESRDKGTEASTNKTYVDMGVKDVQLVQEELGVDPDVQERIRKEKEAKEQASQMQPGGGAQKAVGGSVSQPGTQTPQQPNPADLMAILGRTTEALSVAVSRLAGGEWLAESRAWVEVDGELWEPDALGWVMEGRDRSHLIKTPTVRKDGVRTYVYRRPNAGTVRTEDGIAGTEGNGDPSSSPRSSAADAEADRVRRFKRVMFTSRNMGGTEGYAALTQMTDDLAHLTRDQIREVVRERGLQVGGLKRQLADRLLADAKARLNVVDKRVVAGDPNAPRRPGDDPDSLPVYSPDQMSNPDNARARADVMGLLKRSGLSAGKRVQIADLFRETGLTEVQLTDALGQLYQLGALNLGYQAATGGGDMLGVLPKFVEPGPGYAQWTPDGQPPQRQTLVDDLKEGVKDIGRLGRWLARKVGSLFSGGGPEVPPLSTLRDGAGLSKAARYTADRLESSVRTAENLTEWQRGRYSEAARTVAGRIPDAAHARIADGLASSAFYPDTKTLSHSALAAVVAASPDDATREWAATQREAIDSGKASPIAGGYIPRAASLHLDGRMANPGGVSRFGFDSGAEEQVYAHEFGHVIDGPQMELSRSAEWGKVWKAELGGGSGGKSAPLTRYATTRPEEGLAEFARLIYGTGHNLPDVEAAFPRAAQFFRRRGLWPDEPGATRESLDTLRRAIEQATAEGDAEAVAELADGWAYEAWRAAQQYRGKGTKAEWDGPDKRKPIYGERAKRALAGARNAGDGGVTPGNETAGGAGRPAPAHRPDGTPSAPSVRDVFTVPVSSLKVDPARFQYKISGIGAGGVTKELKGTSTWNPELGGVLLAWRDPADGQDYVVNGHHRHELATRAGAGVVNVRYIDAPDANIARARGALANIAEGRGTATDAAKFLRGTGGTVDNLRAAGISMSGKLAADAVQLQGLSDKAFQSLAEGRIDEPKAVAVAKHLKDRALQDLLFRKLADREEEGKDWTAGQIETAARKMAAAGKTTVAGKDLFGEFEDEHSTFDQEVELESHVARALGQEANDFGAVASKRRADRVAGAGNVLDVGENARLRDAAASEAALFDTHANLVGPVSAAIKKGAAELARAKAKKEKDRVKSATLEAVRLALAGLLAG